MPAVNATDAIVYGFRIIGYFIVVAVVGFVVMAIGSGFLGASQGGLTGSPNIGGMIFGGLILLAGVLVFYAGTFGVLYKVIADGVKVGVESAQ